MPKESPKFNIVLSPGFAIQKKNKHYKQGLKFTIVLPQKFLASLSYVTRLKKRARVYKIIIQSSGII